MYRINPHYAKLTGSYLFSTVAQKQHAFQDAPPEVEVIRLSIGDVSQPLAPAVFAALHEGVDEMSQEEYRDAAIAAVKRLSADVGIPTKCEEIKESDLDALAKDALADACYPGNPREATHAQVVEMFRKLM